MHFSNKIVLIFDKYIFFVFLAVAIVQSSDQSSYVINGSSLVSKGVPSNAEIIMPAFL